MDDAAGWGVELWPTRTRLGPDASPYRRQLAAALADVRAPLKAALSINVASRPETSWSTRSCGG